MIDNIKAYAKINLHLEVLNKRPDGYHNICTIMAKVNLFDLLQLNECTLLEPGKFNIHFDSIVGRNKSAIDSISINQNLIAKAIRLYCNTTHMGLQATIAIKKDIPAGAGLGGGSADAAAMLIMLNRIYSRYNHEELCALSAQLGADVPFCLDGNIALCEGIGEIVSPLPPLHLPHNAIIVYDEIHSETKDAYAALGRNDGIVASSKDVILSNWDDLHIPLLLQSFTNDFQGILFRKHPQLGVIVVTLNGFNPDFVQMTGSGSAVYALFYDDQKALSAFDAIKHQFSQVFMAQLLIA